MKTLGWIAAEIAHEQTLGRILEETPVEEYLLYLFRSFLWNSSRGEISEGNLERDTRRKAFWGIPGSITRDTPEETPKGTPGAVAEGTPKGIAAWTPGEILASASVGIFERTHRELAESDSQVTSEGMLGVICIRTPDGVTTSVQYLVELLKEFLNKLILGTIPRKTVYVIRNGEEEMPWGFFGYVQYTFRNYW